MKYTMSKEALAKLTLIQGAVDGRYTVKEIAKRLGLTERRVKQLKKAFKQEGENAFIHGNSGRHPANYTDDKLRKKIITLKKSDLYDNTNFTHFQELLEEQEGIQISYSTLSGILKEAGITSKRKHRGGGKIFKRRKRRSSFGEMLQGDASSYDWFGTGKRCALHGFIDDATGKLTGLYFCQNECLMGYLEVLRQTLINYGIPSELYVDRAGIFLVNTKKEEFWSVEELLAGRPLDKTQFTRIAEEQIGIKMIYANTAQAKGRVERLWGTLQDRLPIWLKLNGITDMDEANRNIKSFINYFNKRFAIKSQSSESSFVPFGDKTRLDKLLTVQHDRTTDNCGCFSFQNLLFQIESKKPLVKKKIKFIFSQKIGLMALYNKTYFSVTCLGLRKERDFTPIPDVIKILIEKNYYADERAIAA
jgi:transposase